MAVPRYKPCMDIHYRGGNLFDAPERHILHGCNNRGGFGSGVAGQMRQRHPAAYLAYMEHHARDHLALGSVHWVQDGPRIVFNGITQDGYGRDGARYVRYEAVRLVMQTVQRLAAGNDGLAAFDAVVMPLIGAGLGGGDWAILSQIIQSECQTVQPIVYLFDGRLPDGSSPLPSP